MRIGELAKRAGTTTRALRFYEAQGLLAAQRAANGYRSYDEDDVRVVAEIRALQAAGFSLAETRPFVACLRAGNTAGDACADSVEVYRRKLADVEACLDQLTDLRADLTRKLAAALAREPHPTCTVETP
ncbi:DNA-binding transcriptional MerR regulator [Actinokineospora baliensis]|uniref:MerR family transcriptional regulator n=1 Tax=Actinokineospora baliensis TaxID=547056 RepID=UPI001957BD8D|nr:MerR family transcriptional regulator [Actinokineospora baliensis]MBM7773477.1 DNA-binding transcriptional MerR regulator [Actinokineospora baliensis]